jgi:DNA-binding NarL/FixJ family response regulator
MTSQSANGTGEMVGAGHQSGKTGEGAAAWRVVVVGDTVISREGMAAILRRDPRFIVCAAVHQREGAEKVLHLHHPDLLLLEPFLESADDFPGIKDIATRFPHVRILVVSRHAEGVYAERALRAGASGYFVKSGTADELLHAAAAVVSSQLRVISPVAPEARHRLLNRGVKTNSDLSNLSNRELEVFSLIAVGHGVGRIAHQLGISRKTVETHCEHIKQKLNYRDAKALKHGAREMLDHHDHRVATYAPMRQSGRVKGRKMRDSA